MAFFTSHFLPALVTIYLLAISKLSSISGARPDKATYSKYSKAGNRSKIIGAFIFGDSTVDSGNNNFILTDFKSNFPPYGYNFVGSQPTGRFTDGKLVTDFIGSYVGVKEYIPPYLDKTLSLEDLKTGVSFASAATGYDPLTAKISNVVSISTQLEYFREYRTNMEKIIGKSEMHHIIQHSGFIISAGTNDIALNYLLVPIRRQSYTIPEYQQYLLSQLQQLLQELVKEGAKTIAVVGLPPIGCLPVVITVFSKDRSAKRECIDSLSSIAVTYNEMVKEELSSESYRSQGVTALYADIYNPLDKIIKDPGKFGFEEVFRGCCGTGFIETSFLCNPMAPLCKDVVKHVFFDSIHPTERTYSILFDSLKKTIDAALATK